MNTPSPFFPRAIINSALEHASYKENGKDSK